MFIDFDYQQYLMAIGAFLLGWLLASIASRLGGGGRAKKRDPKDDRIRSLEAELRIAQTEASETREKLERAETELEDALDGIEKRDNVISHQQSRVEEIKRDLKESVTKTRQLRHELQDRAAESVKSEARIREVETELSIAQASTDLIATGVLDYNPELDGDIANELDPDAREAGSGKS